MSAVFVLAMYMLFLLFENTNCIIRLYFQTRQIMNCSFFLQRQSRFAILQIYFLSFGHFVEFWVILAILGQSSHFSHFKGIFDHFCLALKKVSILFLSKKRLPTIKISPTVYLGLMVLKQEPFNLSRKLKGEQL